MKTLEEINHKEAQLKKYLAWPAFSQREELDINKADECRQLMLAQPCLDHLMNVYQNTPEGSRQARYALVKIAHLWMYAETYDEAINAFHAVMQFPNTVGNPLLHLRIGESLLALGDERQAIDNLARALIMGGLELFEGEPAILKEIPLTHLKPPAYCTWEEYQGQDWSSTA
jgi:tetratricopeptide (TPR) repeat protein